MKRFFAVICCIVIIASALTASVFAGKDEFFADYFPGGKIKKPETGYVNVDNRIGDSTKIDISFPISDQIYKFGQDYEKSGYTAFCEKYGFEDSSVSFSVQVDYSLNGTGKWQYTSAWDKDASYGSAYIGYATKVETQRIMYIHDINNEFYIPLKSAIISGTKSDGTQFAYLDLENNSLYFRYRYCISYTALGEFEESHVFSDWSDAFSYVTEESGNKINAPEKLPAPTLSEPEFVKSDDGNSLEFDLEFPKEFYEAELYFEEYGGNSGKLEAQVAVNDGEWVTAIFADAEWKSGGTRKILIPEDVEIKDDDVINLRVRLTDGEPIENSPWSETVSVKNEKPEPADTTAQAPDVSRTVIDVTEPVTEKKGSDCEICGICPVQPLGVCLFVWLVIVIILAILIIAIINATKKKKNKKRKSKHKKK